MSLGLLTGCGYFGDDPVEDSDLYTSENLSGGCKIDTDELAQILEKDVEVQINCLEENLDKFAKYVKREDSNAITNKELSSFIQKFFSNNAALMVGSIKLMFDISGIVLSDNSSSLQTKNIKPLFELLRVVNKKLYRINDKIENFDEVEGNLQETSEAIKAELAELVDQMDRLIEYAAGGNPSDLNLKTFIINLKDQFDIEVINLELVDSLLSFKKLFLGGQREVLTQRELKRFLEMVPELGALSFRLFFANKNTIGNNSELFHFYQSQIQILEEFIFSHKRDEDIISRDEILALVETFIDEEGIVLETNGSEKVITLSDIMEISDSLKRNILGLGANPENYNFQEVSNFIKIVESGLGILSVYETYNEVVEGGVNSKEWYSGKAKFIQAVNIFKEEMVNIWANNNFFPNYMRPVPFINDVVELIVEDFEYKDISSDVLGIGKVALVGGNRYQLSKDQLIEVIFKLDGIAEIVFDFANADANNHSDQDIVKLRFKQLKIVKELLDEDLFIHIATVDELLTIASHVMKDEVIVSYKPTIEELKGKILGGYRSTLTLRDIKNTLDLVIDFYSQRYFASISYDLYKNELESSQKISKNFEYTRSHEDFDLYTPAQLKKLKAQFVELTSKIRLFRSKNGYQYYGDDIQRTKFGLLEHYMIDFAFELLAGAMGHENESGELEFTLEELNNLLFTFEPILKEYGLWSAHPETFARNTLLLADLFQANSNGSVTIDAMEVSEYGTLALFAIKAADELIEKTNNYCDQYTKNGVTGFAPECYREHFFNVLLNELKLKEYLPKLNRYITESSQDEKMEFLVAIEGFAKDYPGPGMPQARRDMVLLIGAILNIESTFLRYDADRSNLLEYNELENGFPVYEEAIINLAGLTGGKKKFAKTIFLYMIKEMKEPSQTDVLFYHYNPFSDKKVNSKRLNIGALLYNMVHAASSDD